MYEDKSWFDKLPSDTLEVCEENLELFFETMFERQTIWKKRFIDKIPQPWTENKIFQNSKFTNVYRDLDRNSQWQIKNIIIDDSLSLKNLIWKIMVFRYFNNPATFEFIKLETGWSAGIPDWDNYDEDAFAELIQAVRDCGANPYTNAYLINSQSAPGKSRDWCYTRLVIPTLHKNIGNIIAVLLKGKEAKELITFLKTLPAVADFIAHEFYQDFTYITKYTHRKIMKWDQNDYTNVGPGCSVGIRLIFPNYKTTGEQKEGIYRLRDAAEEWLASFGRFPYLNWDKTEGSYYVADECNITLHQIEMWLCEFQKYWKMTIGQGKQRSQFVPKSKKIVTKPKQLKLDI